MFHFNNLQLISKLTVMRFGKLNCTKGLPGCFILKINPIFFSISDTFVYFFGHKIRFVCNDIYTKINNVFVTKEQICTMYIETSEHNATISSRYSFPAELSGLFLPSEFCP